MTVREQLRRLMNKFKVPRTTSEGMFAPSLNLSTRKWTFMNLDPILKKNNQSLTFYIFTLLPR